MECKRRSSLQSTRGHEGARKNHTKKTPSGHMGQGKFSTSVTDKNLDISCCVSSMSFGYTIKSSRSEYQRAEGIFVNFMFKIDILGILFELVPRH